MEQLETVRLLDVNIHLLPLDRLLSILTQAIVARRRVLIAYVNAHALNLAYEQPWFRDFLNTADIVFCDGFGVKWGARLLGLHIPQRYTPPDWMPALSQACIQHGFSMFLLGARPGVAECAAARLRERFPALHIGGTHHGYFDKTPGSPENEAVIARINAAKPNILIVGFGMPLQERWLMENWGHIEANVALTAGAVFDYLAGTVRRGPQWMTSHGLEWLARLVIEPRRLWRRYLLGNPLFFWRLWRERAGGNGS